MAKKPTPAPENETAPVVENAPETTDAPVVENAPETTDAPETAPAPAPETAPAPVVENAPETTDAPVVESKAAPVASGISVREIASKMIPGKTYTNAAGEKLVVVADMYGNRVLKQTAMFGLMEVGADDLVGVEL